MKIVGLTGGIATGKSTVVRMFRELGSVIVDADLLARKVVEKGSHAYNEIIREFGQGILDSNGNINREKLGEIVFTNSEAREKLNKITHPRVFALIQQEIKKAEKDGAEVVILDIPLLFESGADSWLNPVILVYADTQTQLKRLMERDGYRAERALARINSQMPIEEKRKKAHFIIDNSGDLGKTNKQVVEIWQKIRK